MKNPKDIIAHAVVAYYSHYPELMRGDILHTQEVVTYTRMIASAEGLPEEEISMLECAAWLHDIGCPRSKEIFGNSLPVNQQSVGREVTREILNTIDTLSLTDEQREWLADVVGTHHQFAEAQRLGYAPLFEADLIVNLLSGYHTREKAPHLYATLMVTKSGKELFKTLIYM